MEAARACLTRMEATEPRIAAMLRVDAEGALARARELDAAGPDPAQTLWGVPVTVKDALSTKGLPTTAGSHILEGFVPIYDAFAVEKLRRAGAVLLGKANLDEFAMGSGTEISAYRNPQPWNTAKVPGGSTMEVRDVNMDFSYGRSFTENSPEAYERLILDVLLGDPPLFPTTEEVNLSWEILDPIEQFWSTLGQPQAYRAGTWGPAQADEMLARDGRHWRMP